MDQQVTFFENAQQFRTWLIAHHLTATELLVGFYKVGAQRPTMTWSASVDEALCYGWIDGVRKSIDAISYSIRFTPRKKNSIWSGVNIKKVEVLRTAGLMTEAGEQAFSYRAAHRSNIYSHEQEVIALAVAYEIQFKDNAAAWAFFERQAPSYKKVCTHWVMSAKQEKTRLSRLEKLIGMSASQQKKGW